MTDNLKQLAEIVISYLVSLPWTRERSLLVDALNELIESGE